MIWKVLRICTWSSLCFYAGWWWASSSVEEQVAQALEDERREAKWQHELSMRNRIVTRDASKYPGTRVSTPRVARGNVE